MFFSSRSSDQMDVGRFTNDLPVEKSFLKCSINLFNLAQKTRRNGFEWQGKRCTQLKSIECVCIKWNKICKRFHLKISLSSKRMCCVWFCCGTEIIFDVARQEPVLRRERKMSSVRRSRHMETEPLNVTHVDPIPSEITSPFLSFWYVCVSALCYFVFSGFYLYSHHSFASACLCAQIQVCIAKYRIKINK